MRIAITGASGLIGTALTDALRRDGQTVHPLVRRASDDPDAIAWDPARGTIDASGLEGVDAVVHLAGAGAGDKRWSSGRKREILESRTGGTDLLARTLVDLDRKPSVLVSASGVHYYGNPGDKVVTESSPAGTGFLTDVVVAWEAATSPASEAGIRTVLIRSGVVLSRRGGALARLLPLFRLGLGGRLGSGKQWWSWISIQDEVAAIRFLIDRSDVSGPVNLTSPQSITNGQLTKALGRLLSRPTLLPVPAFGPRLVFGREMADEVVFASQRVEPRVLVRSGYEFRHPDIDSGLRAALDA